MPINLKADQILIATSLLTVVAAFRLISDSNRPYIGLSLRFGVNNFPTLVIQNIGNRTARNLRLNFAKEYKPLLQQIGAKDHPIEGYAPFKNGLAALIPGEIAAYVFYMDPKIWEEKEALLLRLKVSYTRTHRWTLFRFRETINLDINDYKSRLIPKNIPE